MKVKRKKYYLPCLLLLGSYIVFSQNPKIDSLLTVLKTAGEDTNKVNALNELSFSLHLINPDSTILLAQQSISLCDVILKEAKNLALKQATQLKKANAYGNSGVGYTIKGDYARALDNYFSALKIDESLNNKTGIAKRLGNIGVVYMQQANYPRALEYYFRRIKLDEELGNKRNMSINLGNIGGVYAAQADYPKALEYYFKALKMRKELGDKNGIAIQLGNIGNVYDAQASAAIDGKGDTDSLYGRALDFYFKALGMNEELGRKSGIAITLGNIGTVYKQRADYPRALGYYFKALKLAEELGDKNRIAIQLGNIGSLYTKTGRFAEAERYLKHSIALYDSIGGLDGTRDFEKALSHLYDSTGRYQLAFEHYKKYIAARDSIANDENTKKQTQQEMNYEFDKQQTADSIRNAEQIKQERLKHEQEIQQQRTYTYGGVMGFLLMIVVTGVSFRAFKSKQRANIIIAEQKQLVEKKQKDILDSIHYARRIQQGLLPAEKYIDKQLRRLKA